MNVLAFETCWAAKNKVVTPVGLSLFNYQDDARPNKHKIDSEYFKHGIYSPFFSSNYILLHNSNVFRSCIIHILYTGCAKFKKKFRCQKDNLISAQKSPVPLPKFQMTPRIKILMGSGSNRGTTIYFSFLSKIPSTRTLSRFRKRATMERDTLLQDIYISLKNLIKIPINRKALRKKRPSMFHKNGTPIDRDTLLQGICISLKNLIKFL